jgi:hypothetical protein
MSNAILRPLSLLVLVASCKADKPSARTDTARVLPDKTELAEYASAMKSLAGDTLTLVSVGGHALQPQSTSLACDSARTPVFQQLIVASDSSLWAHTVYPSTCPDSLESSSDTVESRGGYRIFGDTLSMTVPGPAQYDRPEFRAIIFPDSVVQTGTGSDNAWHYSRRRGQPGDPTTMGAAKIDTVYLARDIDGSGKPDYIVRETRLGPDLMPRENRIAIYIDGDPASRRPTWAKQWDSTLEENQALAQSLQLSPASWLLDIAYDGGDFSGDDVLIVERGSIRKEIYHGIDYGNGYLKITQEAGKVVVETSLDNLELDGSPVESAIKCKSSEWRAIRLIFDPAKNRFTPDRAFCKKIPQDDAGPEA